ncbi:MAG: integral membrane sensor signal transduction histidine kinase [Bacillota bacterium]|nr:MAG: integral membrane sensor signal transduction histidine kinase [Bacillota bacterium]
MEASAGLSDSLRREMASIKSVSLYEKIAIVYRALGILLLYILWVQTDSGMAGLFLLLVLLTLMLLRWRFPPLGWTIVIDQLAVVGVTFLWDSSRYVLALGMFDAVYLGCPFLAIPTVLYSVIYKPESILYLLLAQSAFVGMALWGWRNHQEEALRRMDEERSRYYETESFKQELLAANVQVAKMAELSERSRIASEIHDHAGHEIVAAYMSLQTAQALFETDPSQAKELFSEALGRLESGMGDIREAVHNLSPFAEFGVVTLRRLCEKFLHCPVEFIVYGDPSLVSVYQWVILEACLKEALTNVLRHADPNKVRATLDITPHIIRLCVENDGVNKRIGSAGLGLRNLQQRAKAVGGNVSTDQTDCFRLVCVLPINQKGC